jgi:hypothetical protein
MKKFNHTRHIRSSDGTIIGEAPAPAKRMTVSELGGGFGSDKRKRLVVTLEAGDVIGFRPEKTQRKLTLPATRAYSLALEIEAARQQRERKEMRKKKRLGLL